MKFLHRSSRIQNCNINNLKLYINHSCFLILYIKQGLVITRLHDYQFLFVLLHGSFFLESFGISKRLHFLLESPFLMPNNRLPDSFFGSFYIKLNVEVFFFYHGSGEWELNFKTLRSKISEDLDVVSATCSLRCTVPGRNLTRYRT